MNHPSWKVLGAMSRGYETVLTGEALRFLTALARVFTPRVKELLARRRETQALLDRGERLDFLPETREIREGAWRVAPLADDLHDRRVEITGPVDRRMVINALNAGASCFMADFEDACSPTWDNLIQGQVNLCDAVAGTISYDDPSSGKH